MGLLRRDVREQEPAVLLEAAGDLDHDILAHRVELGELGDGVDTSRNEAQVGTLGA